MNLAYLVPIWVGFNSFPHFHRDPEERFNLLQYADYST